jgi:nitrogen fixation protein FixH
VAGPSITHADHLAAAEAADQKVEMSLGGQGRAALAIVPATTRSHLHLALSDTHGRPIAATRVTLKVANPDRNIAPISVPMSPQDGVWIANYRFPFPGKWKVILTVDGAGPSAVVTSGNITIRN